MLLQAIHDVFSLAEVADCLRTIKPGSKQVEIFTAMLKHVCNCGDFIQSYAKDTQFCRSSLPVSLLVLNTWFLGRRIFKNIGGKCDAKIEDYCTTLFHLRDVFLNHATVNTEITTLQILDDMDIISTQIAGISNQVLDASA